MLSEVTRCFKKNTADFFAIHYSCESLNDSNDGYSPRITSIAVLHMASDTMHSFSIHLVAERMHIELSKIKNHYNTIEQQMLTDFFDFLQFTSSAFFIHWNMSNINYGFDALEHRYRVLHQQEVPCKVPDSHKYNLSDIICQRYGADSIDNPKMYTLMELNGGRNKKILTGQEEVDAFCAKEFIKLHTSTMLKTYWIKQMFFLFLKGKIRTSRSNWKEKINNALEHPVSKIIGAAAVVATLIQSIPQVVECIRAIQLAP